MAVLLLCTTVFFSPLATAQSAEGSRNTAASSERKQVRTGDNLSDRKKRDEEIANAPPPPPRAKTPEVPVNPAPAGPAVVPAPGGR